MDPYAILGVEPDASPAQIREAFRALVRDRHPDTAPSGAGVTPAVGEVIEAYRLLMDPATRARYDHTQRSTPPEAATSVRCPGCGGAGTLRTPNTCSPCGGAGSTTFLTGGGAHQQVCRACGGSGRQVRTTTCLQCDGTGRV